MNSNQLSYVLQSLFIIMTIILVALIVILVVILIKKAQGTRNTTEKKEKVINKEKEKKTPSATAQYSKQSIFDFMEFEKIEDNMIIVKEGYKYLMVMECQGINYDLMSGLEKVSVEQGFIQFLNTLRQPIQLYTQTRTVNLGNSINNYKARIESIGKKLDEMNIRHDELINSETALNVEEIERLQYEIVKQKNLYDYGMDILGTVEKMSLNKGILRKYYYIIVPYYAEDISSGKYDKEEIKGLAFSELYTNCQSMIQSLGACSINAKILNSREIAELLYVAYNRDESEDYELERVIRSGYNELYTTSQEVLDKKMAELDKEIYRRARELANVSIRNVITESIKEKEVKEKERKIKTLTKEKAKEMLTENEGIIGKEIAEKAKSKIDEEQKKGEDVDEKARKTRKATRRKQ